MKSNITPYSKGATVFLGRAHWGNELIDCPVCNGTQRVLIKPLGADDSAGSSLPCEFCRQRHHEDLPPGKVVDRWHFKPYVETIRIEGVETKDSPSGVQIRYMFNIGNGGGSYNIIDHNQVVASYAEAEHLARQAADKANNKAKVDLAQTNGPQGCDKKSQSWRVGYHKQQIKDGEKRITDLKNDIENEERRMLYAKEQLGLLKKK